ncbi:helix-turn-helix domain-containing protein [Streptomyces sp. NPDC003737]|uniref:helix-turn-helix domain-containing protein n=1 Tax=Streptomyces sp. NPDC003737 TaxID=3364685 RepID=UPI0036A6900B
MTQHEVPRAQYHQHNGTTWGREHVQLPQAPARPCSPCPATGAALLPTSSSHQIRHARGLLTDPENTITSIAKLLEASRTTLYKYVPELAAGPESLVPSARQAALPAVE